MATATSKATNRIYSLDTLRGLAIFGMILSGLIPWTGLPSWMYHCQVPPPDHVFNPNLPGITWVDLVYPFFMFSLGAAIPLALSRRLEKMEPLWKIIGHVFWRGVLMMALALYIDNSSPWALYNNPSKWIWFRSLMGFGCILLMLARWPNEDQWEANLKYLVKAIGLAGIVLLMWTVKRADGTGFNKDSSDIIIRLLGFAYVCGSLLWLASRNSLMMRLGILGAILALRIHTGSGGQLIAVINPYFSKVGWLFGPGWVDLMLMVLPGTIIGDALLQWSKRPKDEEGLGISLPKILMLLSILLAIVIGGLIYFKMHYVNSGLLYTVCMCILGHLLLRESKTPMGQLLKEFFGYATFFLIVGYMLDPFEHGIKKDPENPSYFLTCVGMAITMLVFFFILMDGLKKGKWVGFLKIVGSNPMLAYIMGSGCVMPLYFILNVNLAAEKFVNLGTWAGTVFAFIQTLTVCLVVYLFTRAKVYLRL